MYDVTTRNVLAGFEKSSSCCKETHWVDPHPRKCQVRAKCCSMALHAMFMLSSEAGGANFNRARARRTQCVRNVPLLQILANLCHGTFPQRQRQPRRRLGQSACIPKHNFQEKQQMPQDPTTSIQGKLTLTCSYVSGEERPNEQSSTRTNRLEELPRRWTGPRICNNKGAR